MEKLVHYHTNGNIAQECYLTPMGEFHREDGPAFICYNEAGIKFEEVYYIDGIVCRKEDKPSVIRYYGDTGLKHLEKYLFNKKYYRDRGPTFYIYYRCGKREEMYLCGDEMNPIYHREDGPTIKSFNNKGRIISREYYYRDRFVNVPGDGEFKKYVKDSKLKEYFE